MPFNHKQKESTKWKSFDNKKYRKYHRKSPNEAFESLLILDVIKLYARITVAEKDILECVFT